jgi:F-type H+-transporting ATPase subunit alpha
MADGQIVLSPALFAAGQKPAIDAALSVSRVGGHAQSPVFKELAGRMRLDYAAFLELEGFARIGTRLEASAERRLQMGRAMRALMAAPRNQPLDVFDEVLRLVLMTEPDLLLGLPLDRAATLVDEASKALRQREEAVVKTITRDQVLGDADRALLTGVLAEALGVSAAG